MNPLVQTSNYSPKNSDRDMHVQVGLVVTPHQTRKWALPLCFLDLRHNNNPKAPQNKQKNYVIITNLIGRTKTYDMYKETKR